MTPKSRTQIKNGIALSLKWSARANRIREATKLAREEITLERQLADVKGRRWQTQVAGHLERVLEICAETDGGRPYALEIFEKNGTLLYVQNDERHARTYLVCRPNLVELAIRQLLAQEPIVFRRELPDRAAEFRQKLGLDRVIPFALSLRQRNP